MKKLFFSILSVVLFSTAVFGSDVLFKMEMLYPGAVTTNAGDSTDLDNYAILIGGSVSAVNTGSSNQSMIHSANDTSYVRISSTATHIHIVLDSALKVGDKILYTEYYTGSSSHSVLATRANTRARYNNNRNKLVAGTEFTVPQATDELAGATELWIWNDENKVPICIKSLTITREGANPLAKEYLFSEETIGAIGSASSTNTLNNGLVVNNDGSANNAIAALGGSKVLYLAGAGENRVATFDVTDPCTIEIWGRSSNANARTVYVAEGSYASTANSNAVEGLSSVARDQLYKGTYNYTGFEDSKKIYVQVDGGFHIAAIRIVYARIRPEANFSVTPAEVTLKVGESQVFTYNKDYADAVINRGKTADSENSWVSRGTEVKNESVQFTALEAGVGHTFTIVLTQVADAYCRQAVVEVPIKIVSTTTTIDETEASAKAVKFIENGQIFILRDGKVFNLTGTRVK